MDFQKTEVGRKKEPLSLRTNLGWQGHNSNQGCYNRHKYTPVAKPLWMSSARAPGKSHAIFFFCRKKAGNTWVNPASRGSNLSKTFLAQLILEEGQLRASQRVTLPVLASGQEAEPRYGCLVQNSATYSCKNVDLRKEREGYLTGTISAATGINKAE